MPESNHPSLNDFDGDILNMIYFNRYTKDRHYFDARDLFVRPKSNEPIGRGDTEPIRCFSQLEAFSDEDIPHIVGMLVQNINENGNRRTFIFDSIEAFRGRVYYDGEPRIRSFAFEKRFDIEDPHVRMIYNNPGIETLTEPDYGLHVKREIPDMYYTFKNNFTSSDIRIRFTIVPEIEANSRDLDNFHW